MEVGVGLKHLVVKRGHERKKDLLRWDQIARTAKSHNRQSHARLQAQINHQMTHSFM